LQVKGEFHLWEFMFCYSSGKYDVWDDELVMLKKKDGFYEGTAKPCMFTSHHMRSLLWFFSYCSSRKSYHWTSFVRKNMKYGQPNVFPLRLTEK